MKFTEGQKVRILVDALGTVKHPQGAKAGAIGTVMHYYSGGVSRIIWVEFPDGFKAEFGEHELEAYQ